MGWETTICCDDQEGPWDGECQNEGSQTGRPTPRAVGVGLAGHFVSLGGERRFQLGVRARRKIGVGGERISREICWHSLPVFHDQLALRHNADVHHRAVSCCRCCRRTAVLGHAPFPPGEGAEQRGKSAETGVMCVAMAARAGVTIVGGGVAGLSLARFLVRCGVKGKVRVLEARETPVPAVDRGLGLWDASQACLGLMGLGPFLEARA